MNHTQRPVRTELVEVPVHPELVEVPGRPEAMFPIVLNLSEEITRVSLRGFDRLSPNDVGRGGVKVGSINRDYEMDCTAASRRITCATMSICMARKSSASSCSLAKAALST